MKNGNLGMKECVFGKEFKLEDGHHHLDEFGHYCA
jgi:hypothetical protein